MNPNREELLFQLALSKPAAKRAAWLDAECDGDAALRGRLDALLAAHEQPNPPLAPEQVAPRPTLKVELATNRPMKLWGKSSGAISYWKRWAKAGAAWSMSRSRPNQCVAVWR